MTKGAVHADPYNSHDSANVSVADRAKQYKKSEVFEDGGKLILSIP